MMKSYLYAVVFIVLVIIIAHVVVGDAYDWRQNSISQLSGQGYSRAWIMRAGFIGFGLLVQVVGLNRLRAAGRVWYREIPIMLYGLCILASGIFSAVPFVEGIAYSEREAQFHTVFATAGGVALTAGSLVYMLTDKPDSRRVVHLIALILLTGISFLFGALESGTGVVQRLLWLAGFAWLIYLGLLTKPTEE